MQRTVKTRNLISSPTRPSSLLFWLSLLLCALQASVVMPQADSDPIPPPLSAVDPSKSIVVDLQFLNGRVASQSVEVVVGHAPSRIGNPPLLRIDLFDFRGEFVEQFNAWHPLWTFIRDDNGFEHLVVETEGTGSIAFPFLAEYGTMKVTDLDQGQEIASVDLFTTVRKFCMANRADSDCRNIADFDDDGDVDTDDLNVLLEDLNALVSKSRCGAPCDLNDDGTINALDARQLVVLCTRQRCATQ